jgi:ABC-type Mn2+/Zn2+ transport system ATPase subunit
MALAVDAHGVVARRGQRVVIDDAAFTVPPSAVTAVIGPNGSGKSTLLYLIAGLLHPAAGSHLTVLDAPAGSQRDRVALVLQSTDVSARLPVTVREVVAMGRYARRGILGRSRPGERDVDRQAVDVAMTRLEVEPLASSQINELSGGQRQRVFVAQGLAQQADLLLLDEPVTGLDMVSRQRILEVARNEAERGVAVVMTTHDLNEAAEADHVLLLTGGKVVQGPPGDVLVPDVLREAYSGRLLVMESDRTVVVDDPHHHEARAPAGPWRRDSDHAAGDGGHDHHH